VLQDVSVGSFVMWVQVAVTDPNSTVQYRLVTSSSVTPGFSIDHDSGVVNTATVLDSSTTYSVSLQHYLTLVVISLVNTKRCCY